MKYKNENVQKITKQIIKQPKYSAYPSAFQLHQGEVTGLLAPLHSQVVSWWRVI